MKDDIEDPASSPITRVEPSLVHFDSCLLQNSPPGAGAGARMGRACPQTLKAPSFDRWW